MINELCNRIGFDGKTMAFLCDRFTELLNEDIFPKFMSLGDALLRGENIKNDTEALSERCGIHPYTLLDLVLIYTLPALEHSYKLLGMERYFGGVLDDIRVKTDECQAVYGIIGNICYDWYIGFFDCTRVCLGRLQLECRESAADFDRWKKGDTVINCHIPSTGPLYEQDCIASFKLAYEYFADARRDGVLPIVCSSWLLHPPTAECYKDGSNLQKFYRMFRVISWKNDDSNHNFWRVFNCEYKDRHKATADTSLRRNILDMLARGQSMGSGYGIILFDGEKIL